MELASLIQPELPYFIYKKPGAAKLQIIQQTGTGLYTDKDFETPGFYFAPYDFIKHPVVVFPENNINKQSFFIRSFSQDTKDIQLNPVQTDSEQALNHQNKVAKALEYIHKGVAEKVIISRKQEVSYRNLDIYQAVLQLMNHYENSFVYLWHHPAIGTWMGATPELLLEYTNNELHTMALAGTLTVTKDKPVLWEMKEINEQQIVTDYIHEKLSKFSDKVFTEKPKTVFQGNLAHIKTDITAHIPPSKLNEVILSLHPTPAVCGIPLQKAKNIIDEIEQYDRKYYTGFLGYKTPGQAQLYVNLRSMEIFPEKLSVYTGGGITLDSQKEKEWKETFEKSKIILSPLLKNYK